MYRTLVSKGILDHMRRSLALCVDMIGLNTMRYPIVTVYNNDNISYVKLLANETGHLIQVPHNNRELLLYSMVGRFQPYPMMSPFSSA